MTLAGFPNFFMLYGPNTNLGHNSIILMIECQVRYVMQCLRLLAERDLQSIDVRPETMLRYNEEVQRSLKTVGLGRGLRELVQERGRQDHQQLAAQHGQLLVADAAARRLRLSARVAPRAPRLDDARRLRTYPRDTQVAAARGAGGKTAGSNEPPGA